MIRVTIESVPHGDKAPKIYVLEIHHEGPTTAWLTDAAGHSDYSVKQIGHNPPSEFRLLAHRESLGVLELVERAISSLRAMGAK